MKNGLFDFQRGCLHDPGSGRQVQFQHRPKMKVADLSVGQMQKVEIMKVLIKGAQDHYHGRAHRRADTPGDGRAV